LLLFLGLAGVLVQPSLSGRRDMVPWDNLSAYVPWRPAAGAGSAPHNALISDIVFQSMAWQRGAHAMFRHGERPRWNPDILCGKPCNDGLLYGYRYPLNLVWRWVRPARAAAWLFGVHLVLGASFTFLLLRRLGAGRAAATLGGTVYSLAAPVYLNMTFHTMQGALAWTPACAWGLLALGRPAAGRRRRAADILAALAAHAMVVCSGHPEVAMYAFALSGTLTLWIALRAARAGRPAGALAPILTFALAAAAAAWIAWPTMTALRTNFRAGTIDLATVRSYGLPAYQLVTLAAPDATGSPVLHRYLDPYRLRRVAPRRAARPPRAIQWGDKTAVEGVMFAGVLTLPLLLLPARLKGAAPFFRAWLLLALLLAFATPVYAAAYHLVPFVRQLRTPFRWLIPAALCVAVLAGGGLQAWLENAAANRRLRRLGFVMAGAATAGILLVAWAGAFEHACIPAVERIVAGAARVRAVFADAGEFLRFGMGQVLSASVRTAAAALVVLWATRSAGRRRRRRREARAWALVGAVALELVLWARPFFTHAPSELGRRVPPAVAYLQARAGRFRVAAFGTEKILPPNTAALYGLQDIRAYESVLPASCVAFFSRIEPQTRLRWNIVGVLEQPATLNSPWLDFLNVRYILADAPVTNAGWTLCFDDGARVYRQQDAYPRYYLSTDAAETFEAGPPRPMTDGACRITGYSPHRVTLSVQAPREAWLVSSETDYGQWLAVVDGRLQSTAPYLGLFRRVRLAAGSHTVEWVLRGSRAARRILPRTALSRAPGTTE
jgi:hypothetical protein